MPLGFSSGRPLTPLIAATSARSSATARLSAAFSARSRSVRASSSARGRPERVIFPEADMAGTGRVHDGTAQPRQLTSARPFAPRTDELFPLEAVEEEGRRGGEVAPGELPLDQVQPLPAPAVVVLVVADDQPLG